MVLLLTGCMAGNAKFLHMFTRSNHSLTIINAREFTNVAKRFRGELQEKGFLDSNGTPRSDTDGHPQEYHPRSYGEEIRTRLSLRFLWSKAERQRTSEHVTHAAIPSAGENVTVQKNTLTIQSEFGSDSYRMVALLDWDGDGYRDWLIRYRYLPAMEGPPSTRLLIISHPGPTGLLDAQVVEAFECKGKRCFSYKGTALPEIIGYDPLVE